MSARAWLSSSEMRPRRARFSRLSTTTTAPTIDVTPKTCLPLIPKRMSGRLLLGLFRPQPQLVQLIVQRFQADAQYFSGARFIVARVLERHQNEPPFCLFDRRSGRERHLRLVLRRPLVVQ